MSLPVILAVGLVGGVGAIARFVLDRQVCDRTTTRVPVGTFVVNILGAWVLGLLVGAALGHTAYTITATGLIGAFTTFSTWTFESHRLGERGRLRLAVLNFALSLVCGVAAVWLGRRLGATL